MSDGGEFTRLVKLDSLPAEGLTIAADESERAALAERFALAGIGSLEADLMFEQDGADIMARGSFAARFEQQCAVAGDPFANELGEDIALRFVPESAYRTFDAEDEIELAEEEFDEIPYSGQAIDIGEAIAQSFGLALDPYAEGPDADEFRAKAGIESDEDVQPSGPLAEALKGLKG